jgi:hypothetical protein
VTGVGSQEGEEGEEREEGEISEVKVVINEVKSVQRAKESKQRYLSGTLKILQGRTWHKGLILYFNGNYLASKSGVKTHDSRLNLIRQ